MSRGSHPWFDIRDVGGVPTTTPPEIVLLGKVQDGALPAECLAVPLPTDVNEAPALAARPFTALHQNVPNPFNPTTRIRFDLAQDGHVTLRIFDVAGRSVRTVVDAFMTAGQNHAVVWNGLDDQSQPVASGIYFYRLDAGGASITRKMVVMR